MLLVLAPADASCSLELLAKSIHASKTSSIDHILDLMLGDGSRDSENDLRWEELLAFLRANPGPTLVYVSLQQQAENHAKALKGLGFSAAAFHAGMKIEDKKRVQEDFMASRVRIVSRFLRIHLLYCGA
jgi:superfamily II DNA/RNA helicase